jgi:NAD(P)-dependent dehydrogenase (short-subunit alcohol dehydrogenase family)
MAGRLAGKVAVVTGGNSGIGLATAQRFAAEGAKVFLTGRRQAELDTAVKAVGHGAVGVQGDVSKLADLDRLYATVKEHAGRVDVLFANAGLGEFAPFGQVTEAHFDKIFDVNVRGLLFSVQKGLPLMPDGASIILNASIAAYKGSPAFSVYSASKAAVRSFARTWTTDLKARRIRVNALCPGPIDTPVFDGFGTTPEDVTALKARFVSTIPMGRMGAPAEAAAAALFLASDESSFVTGIELAVDGGRAQV